VRFSQEVPILPSNHEIGNGGQNTTGESKNSFLGAELAISSSGHACYG
jgi:hypothetical protein